jgi:peptide/nickel transport system ATP-binding protein
MPRSFRSLPVGASGRLGNGGAGPCTARESLPSRTTRSLVIPLLDITRVSKQFVRRRGLFGPPAIVTAVDDVSLTIGEGEVVGLVGESGSGKTTLARCALRLIEPTAGDVAFRGESVLAVSRTRLRELRRQMQIVFQDPFSSLDPRMRVGSIVQEPLDIHRVGPKKDRRARVAELLTLVGLDVSLARRYPREFSGGQRQRIGLARALALNPSLIVADEPVSALDVSVQAQIVNLLLELRERLGLTYLFIAHDLRLVEHICNRTAVMYRGRLVEIGPTRMLFTSPRHPYTEALLSAVPKVQPGAVRPRIVFDPAALDPRATLREVASGHWAAV